jgi:hypothetical protein
MVKLSVEGFPQAVKALCFDVDRKSTGFPTLSNFPHFNAESLHDSIPDMLAFFG